MRRLNRVRLKTNVIGEYTLKMEWNKCKNYPSLHSTPQTWHTKCPGTETTTRDIYKHNHSIVIAVLKLRHQGVLQHLLHPYCPHHCICTPNTCASCLYTNLQQVLEWSAEHRACVISYLMDSINSLDRTPAPTPAEMIFLRLQVLCPENLQAERRVFCSALQQANRMFFYNSDY